MAPTLTLLADFPSPCEVGDGPKIDLRVSVEDEEGAELVDGVDVMNDAVEDAPGAIESGVFSPATCRAAV